MTAENFVQFVQTAFEKIETPKGPFFGFFGLILAILLTNQSYNFDVIAHIGLYYSEKRLQKILFKVYQKFQRKSEKVEFGCFFYPILG